MELNNWKLVSIHPFRTTWQNTKDKKIEISVSTRQKIGEKKYNYTVDYTKTYERGWWKNEFHKLKTFKDKKQAMDYAISWMKKHPKG